MVTAVSSSTSVDNFASLYPYSSFWRVFNATPIALKFWDHFSFRERALLALSCKRFSVLTRKSCAELENIRYLLSPDRRFQLSSAMIESPQVRAFDDITAFDYDPNGCLLVTAHQTAHEAFTCYAAHLWTFQNGVRHLLTIPTPDRIEHVVVDALHDRILLSTCDIRADSEAGRVSKTYVYQISSAQFMVGYSRSLFGPYDYDRQSGAFSCLANGATRGIEVLNSHGKSKIYSDDRPTIDCLWAQVDILNNRLYKIHLSRGKIEAWRLEPYGRLYEFGELLGNKFAPNITYDRGRRWLFVHGNKSLDSRHRWQGEIVVWNLSKDETLSSGMTPPFYHFLSKERIHSIKFDSALNQLVVLCHPVSKDETQALIKIWDMNRASSTPTTFPITVSGSSGLSFNYEASSRLLIMVQKGISIWCCRTGQLLKKYSPEFSATSSVWDSKNKKLILFTFPSVEAKRKQLAQDRVMVIYHDFASQVEQYIKTHLQGIFGLTEIVLNYLSPFQVGES